jgi:signal transduction histidine kinase
MATPVPSLEALSVTSLGSNDGKVRVLLVDDHVHVRRSLREAIELSDDYVVIDEAGTGTEAVTKTRSLKPDVVLMDMKMPEMDGVEATRLIKAEHPETRVLALTAFSQMSWVARMLEAGASGYLLKGGSTEELLRSIRAVDEGGGALDTNVTTTVIDDLARLYREEHERALALEDLDKMKTEFMSIISHELRTPATVIRAGVKTLRTRGHQIDDETRDSFLETIDVQSEKLTHLINRILMVSMLRAERIDVDAETVRADAVARTIFEELDERSKERLTLEVVPATARGDFGRVHEVLTSLIDNALVYTRGGVRVSVRSAGDGVLIAVGDEGPGMNPETLELVLEHPFLQGNASDTREVGGLGLSLYIASRVLRIMGGRLDVESDPAGGSTFTIVLPSESGRGSAPSSWNGSVLLWK